MTAFDPGASNTRFKRSSPRLLAYSFYIAGVIAALIAAAILVSAQI
jgi:hypothetical protein